MRYLAFIFLMGLFFTMPAYAAEPQTVSGTGKITIKPLHPRDGMEEPIVEATHLQDIDPKTYAPLVGAAYRGSLRREGVFQTKGVTDNPKVAWKFQTKGPVVSSPVVVDSLLYCGSDDGSFYALDAGSGALVWEVKTGKAVQSSAVVGGGAVYFCNDNGMLYALDAKTGQERWKQSASKYGKPVTTSPLLVFGVVISGARDFANWVGFDAKTGERVCRFREFSNTPAGIGSAALDGDRLCFASAGEIFGHCYSIKTERELWMLKQLAGYSSANTTVIADGVVYFSGSLPSFRGAGLSAVELDSGKVLWSIPLEHEKPNRDHRSNIFCSPAVWKGVIYIGCEIGILYAVDAKDGKSKLWAFKASDVPIQSSPSISTEDKTLYFGSFDKHLYALDLENGKLRWKLPFGDKIRSSPWVADGMVYIGCDDGCISALQ